MRVCLVANCVVPLDSPMAGGMEVSAGLFAQALTQLNEESKVVDIDLIASEDTRPLDGVRLIGTPKVPPCDERYSRFGDGPSKWEHIFNDLRLAERVASLTPLPDVVHDVSSSHSVATVCAQRAIPYVRSVRLMPYHPAYAATAPLESQRIYLTKYQSLFEPRQVPRSSVIPDPTPTILPPFSPTIRGGHFISVGRVERRKGHETAADLAQRDGRRLYIVGPIKDAEYASFLTDKWPCVKLFGELPHRQTLDMIAGSSGLLWFPSVPEPGGRVVLESLALGVPVLCSKVGYAYDLWESSHGHSSPTTFFGEVELIRLDPSCISRSANGQRQWAMSHMKIYETAARNI